MKLSFILDHFRKWQDELKKHLSSFYVKALNVLPITIGCLAMIFFLPTLFMVYLTYGRYQDLASLQERIVLLEKKAKKTFASRFKEAAFMKQAQLADPAFVAKHLTFNPLLQNEKVEIDNLRNIEILKESPFLLKRQETLARNKMCFEAKQLQEKNNLQEIKHALKTPIEANVEDIKQLLEIVEGEKLSSIRPQLLFQHISLKRKEITSNYTVFEVDCDLLERSLKNKEK